jgi:hypothetical protein
MCRRSPTFRAGCAGARLKEPVEGIDPGGMAITPLHPEPVGTDESNRERAYVTRYGDWIEQPPTAHFFHAPCTGTCQTQIARGKEALVSVLVPLDSKSVVLAVNRVGYRVWQFGIRREEL